MAAIGLKFETDYKEIPISKKLQTRKAELKKVIDKIKSLPEQSAPLEIGAVRIEHHLLSQSLSLNDFRISIGTFLEGYIVEVLKLEPTLQLFDHLHHRMQSTDPEILEQISLLEFQETRLCLENPSAKARIALANEEEILSIQVDQLSFMRLPILAMKISDFAQKSPTFKAKVEQQAITTTFFSRRMCLSVAKLRTLPADQIVKSKTQLPKEAFEMLTDIQFLEIDFTKLSRDQLIDIFTHHEPTIQRRLSFCTKERFDIMLDKDAMLPHLLDQFPIAAFPVFPLERLSKPDLKNLFSGFYNTPEIERQRVQALPPVTLNMLLKNEDLPIECLDVLSDEQLKTLDGSSLSQSQVDRLFSTVRIESEQEKRAFCKKRAELLPKEIVDRVQDEGILKLLAESD